MRTVTVGGMPIGDGHPTRIMGVLNMSPQSGFEPSVHADAGDAVRFVEEDLVGEGADVVDVGLQSANVKYDVLPAETELERLDWAAEVVARADDDVPFAIETRYAAVADEALSKGFDVVNDVGGFADPDMRPVCEAHGVPVVKMASPPDVTRPGAVVTMDETFEALERGGFTDRTMIDPAFGKWTTEKTFADDRERFRRLGEFRAFGRPILTATNREDFLGEIAGRPDTADQLPVSLAAATLEADRGAHVVRTHDVAETRDVVAVADALGPERVVAADSPRVVEYAGATTREIRRQVARRGGDPAEARLGDQLAFAVAGLSADERAALEAAGAEHGATVAASADEGAYLAGTSAAVESVAAAVTGTSPGLTELAGTVRRALGAHGD